MIITMPINTWNNLMSISCMRNAKREKMQHTPSPAEDSRILRSLLPEKETAWE
jgi:hypothetical protein